MNEINGDDQRIDRVVTFMNQFPTAEFETGERAETEVLPDLVSALGFSTANLFYSVWDPGTGSALRADAVISTSRLARPWGVVELKVRPLSPDDFGRLEREMSGMRERNDASFALLIAPNAVGISTSESVYSYTPGRFSREDRCIALDQCYQGPKGLGENSTALSIECIAARLHY